MMHIMGRDLNTHFLFLFCFKGVFIYFEIVTGFGGNWKRKRNKERDTALPFTGRSLLR